MLVAVVATGGLAFTIWKTRADILRAEKEKRIDVERARNDRIEEHERERRDKQLTKRAEIAGDALVGALDLLATLHDVTPPVIVAWEDLDEAGMQPFREHLKARVRNVTASVSEFKKAWQRAETYLPEEAVVVLEDIARLANEIRFNQANLIDLPAGYNSPSVQSFFREGLGKVPQDRIAALRARAREILRPLAQLEPARPSGAR